MSKELAKAIVKSAAPDFKYQVHQWLAFLCQDVLAGFGVKLEQPWDKERHDKLFNLGQMFAQIVIDNPYTDILGATYMELSTGNKHLGQFFTPQPLALAAAQALFQDEIKQEGVITVLEPASGSGVMLLAALSTMIERYGVTILNRLSITAIDIDRLCALMTATQLIANSFIHNRIYEFAVFNGDTLANKDLRCILSITSSLHQQTIPATAQPKTPNQQMLVF